MIARRAPISLLGGAAAGPVAAWGQHAPKEPSEQGASRALDKSISARLAPMICFRPHAQQPNQL
jgi:hypothetical protein